MNLEAEMLAMGQGARAAATVLRTAFSESKNAALLAASEAIRANQDLILAANAKDLRAAGYPA